MDLVSSFCPDCNGTGRILEDHDGRAGYRKCTFCEGGGRLFCGCGMPAERLMGPLRIPACRVHWPEPEDVALPKDKFEEMFERQTKFMQLLKEHDRLPEWPIDLRTKPGQRMLKEMMFNLIEEVMEASFTLRNKMHRLTDATSIDVAHFKEELGDALAFWMEVCIMAGFTPREMFEEYSRKNDAVVKRLKDGY